MANDDNLDPFKPPAAEVSWPILANRTQGLRAVGGRLHLEDGVLRFEPNIIDKVLFGKSSRIAIDTVSSVGIEPGRFSLLELFSGGLRSRLRVETTDGRKELFVVWRPDDVVAYLSSLLEDR